jgi:U3 small nucleolar RNA-associated protein 15
VFDANSRGLLRQFKGHKRAAHVAQFSPDKLHVLSGGDDVTVRLWDLSSGAQVCRLDGHADYVRAAAVAPNNDDTWVTGG